MAPDHSPVESTLIRLLVPLGFWTIRILMSASSPGSTSISAPAVDVALVALHEWANQPLRKHDPERFGRNDSITKFLLAPEAIALFLLARDVWVSIEAMR